MKKSAVILIIDGQGGRIGREVVQLLAQTLPEAELIAVGTNSIATATMLKAGVKRAATGENAVATACRRADFIIGPVGIVIADSLLGEVTPEMAKAVGQSGATRILIPVNKCETVVAGVPETPVSELIADAVKRLGSMLEDK